MKSLVKSREKCVASVVKSCRNSCISRVLVNNLGNSQMKVSQNPGGSPG